MPPKAIKRGRAGGIGEGDVGHAAEAVVPPPPPPLAPAPLPSPPTGVVEAAAPHAVGAPQKTVPAGCHLFGEPATVFNGKFTVPIRLDADGDWLNSYSSWIVRKDKDTAFCLLPHSDGTSNVIKTAGGGWPSNPRKHVLHHHSWLLTVNDCSTLKVDPVTRKSLAAAGGGAALLDATTTVGMDDDDDVGRPPAKGTLTAMFQPKLKIVNIADHAPRYVAESRASFEHLLSLPMRSMINGIAAELGGSIKWCSRTHLTKKTDELMAAHLKKANAILKTDIVDVPNAKCGVTFDAGQAKNGHSFLALTIHWMTFEAGPRPKLRMRSTVGGGEACRRPCAY